MGFWSEMRMIFKKKNPIKKLRRSIKEYFFFKDKRPLFDVNLEGAEFEDANFKNRSKDAYFECGTALREVFVTTQIMDIGCANGYLLEYFYKNGVKDIRGLEVAEAAFKYMAPEVRERVIKTDLAKNLKASLPSMEIKRYYLVNCMEVGEHIPYKYEDTFLKNVELFVGRYLVLSWADTWEGWHGMEKQSHVNPRSKRYIKNRLRRLNLKFNGDLTKALVRCMAKRRVYEHWTKRVMVFERQTD